MREKKSRDLGNIRCIKSEDQRVLVKDDEIKERWSIFVNCLMRNNTREHKIE